MNVVPTSSLFGLLFCAIALTCACDKPTSSKPTSPSPPVTAKTAPSDAATTTSKKQVEKKAYPPARPALTQRVVAVGDVHGDLESLKKALAIAGVYDVKSDGWVGEDTVLVQTGDLLDRGDDEQAIIDFLRQLQAKAKAKGGQVKQLLGNHETMNVRGDLRYVTPGGFEDFQDVAGLDLSNPKLVKLPEMARARQAAFMPGGPYAKVLATYDTIGIVGDSIFVHGGVLPSHVEYGVARLNDEVKQWILGQGKFPTIMDGAKSPLWTRLFSQQADLSASQCATLDEVLKSTGTKRMVVGHTPQKSGPTSSCGGKIWRIDTGMAKHYGGKPAALEIKQDVVKVLSE